ncbi:alpha/beta hydrolase [Rossellomorea vietnamensis]|uniref:Alpha/beta hydrolase n=1 Tax=Rossellomorea vietnamensis TaxID=218284 RepID=A0A5D4NS97_9BACI|nr:alpha/beta hydrolase [Rossellomorea vietnamensis]TYS16186.1 alpha/beta hydrolase [Rossellomorea vietnamensis]
MFKVYTNAVEGYKGMEVPYSIVSKSEGCKNIAIILPGAGYTVQSPLLHFSTSVFLNKSFDVLQINYRYNDKLYDDFSMAEISEAIKVDVNTVIDEVFFHNSYENIYLIGKSLGTIPLGGVLNREDFSNAKAIWLTPLIQREDVLESLVGSKNKGLLFIGDQDPYYISERFEEVSKNPNVTAKLIPEVNHILEYNEKTLDSIDVLKRILGDIYHF